MFKLPKKGSTLEDLVTHMRKQEESGAITDVVGPIVEGRVFRFEATDAELGIVWKLRNQGTKTDIGLRTKVRRNDVSSIRALHALADRLKN